MHRPPKLRRLFTLQQPKPHRAAAAAAAHLHLTAAAPPHIEHPSSTVTQIVSIIKSNDSDKWNTNPQLSHLLFSNSPSLSSFQFLQITRQLGTSAIALQFLKYLQSSSGALDNGSLSLTLQGVFELVIREPNSQNKVLRILKVSNELGAPLTVNSVIVLIRCLSRAGMIDELMGVYCGVDESLKNSNVRNVLIDGLLRNGRLGDALNVFDEMVQRNSVFKPNGNTGDIVFSALLKTGKYEKRMSEEEIIGVFSKLGDYGVFPDSLRLTQWITKFCRNGRSDSAWDLLHLIMKLNGPVEAPSCNALLTGLGRDGEFEKMNLLMKEMKEKGIIPNVVTFGIIINHLCKSRRLDQALEVFNKMREEKESGVSIEPDVVIYNTLIDGLCKIGRHEEGLALMQKMRSENKCFPTTVTYNCLIDGFCKASEIERAHELFDEMNKDGIHPNVITMNSLVDGMCRHARTSSALEFLCKMKEKGLQGNAVTYTSLITAFCNVNNIDKAMDLFHEMREVCTPDAIVYYTLISGLCRAGRLDDASSVVSEMKKAGFSPDIGCYNVLISSFCKKNKLDKAHEFLKEMERVGVRPDGVTYNTLISHFSKVGDFKMAHKVLKRMVNDGLVPTVVTYGALIHAYCLVGDVNEAMKLFKELNSNSKIPANTVIYNILIDSLSKNQKVETALSLLDDMKVKGVRPNTHTFNAIFKGLQELNWLEKAYELMDRMVEEGLNPDYVTMEILTEWLSVVGETDRLRRFVQGYEVSVSAA